jgi:hypothetical protein
MEPVHGRLGHLQQQRDPRPSMLKLGIAKPERRSRSGGIKLMQSGRASPGRDNGRPGRLSGRNRGLNAGRMMSGLALSHGCQVSSLARLGLVRVTRIDLGQRQGAVNWSEGLDLKDLI